MKFFKLCLPVLLSLCVALSCNSSEEDETSETLNLEDLEVVASIETAAVTDAGGKVYLNPKFEIGDELKILFGSYKTSLYENLGSEGKSASFLSEEEGTYTKSSSIVYFYKAVYPVDQSLSFTADSVIVNFSQYQNAEEDALSRDKLLLLGRSKDGDIKMFNALSYVSFSVNRDDVSSVELSANCESVALSGKTSFSFDSNGAPYVSCTDYSSKSITFRPSEGYYFKPGVKYIAPILPAAIKDEGVTILMRVNGAYLKTNKSISSDLTVNKIIDLSVIDTTTEEIKASEAYSISDGLSVVHFSTGNLQYDLSSKTWSLAPDQLSFVGNSLGNKDVTGKTGKVDLFVWSVDGNSSNWGLNNVTEPTEDYTTGSFKDWGKNRIVSSDGKTTFAAGVWRTISSEEIRYILYSRETSWHGETENARFAKVTVEGIPCLLLFPDRFKWPSDIKGLKNVNVFNASFSDNVLTADQYRLLDDKGMVFLPASGFRSGKTVSQVGQYGYYWTSDAGKLETGAVALHLNEEAVSSSEFKRCQAYSVRLVSTLNW